MELKFEVKKYSVSKNYRGIGSREFDAKSHIPSLPTKGVQLTAVHPFLCGWIGILNKLNIY